MHIIFLIKHTYTNFFGYKKQSKTKEKLCSMKPSSCGLLVDFLERSPIC